MGGEVDQHLAAGERRAAIERPSEAERAGRKALDADRMTREEVERAVARPGVEGEHLEGRRPALREHRLEDRSQVGRLVAAADDHRDGGRHAAGARRTSARSRRSARTAGWS